MEVPFLQNRFDYEFNNEPKMEESSYVLKIVDPIKGQAWTSASGPFVEVNCKLWKRTQDQERQWWPTGGEMLH